jgi:hypothetical protein
MSTQAGPRTPSLSAVLSLYGDALRQSIHTALPGRVETYDSATQKADVKPLVKNLVAGNDGTEILETIPVIPAVPVMFPRAGGFFITLPVTKGDHVMLVFNERSIDKFKAGQGTDTDPDDFRTHHLSDAVAIPGFYPFGESVGDSGIDDNLVLGKEGGAQIHIKPNGEVHLAAENAADFVALKAKVESNFNAINAFIAAIAPLLRSIPVVPEPGAGAPSAFQAALTVALATISTPSTTAVGADKVKAT